MGLQTGQSISSLQAQSIRIQERKVGTTRKLLFNKWLFENARRSYEMGVQVATLFSVSFLHVTIEE